MWAIMFEDLQLNIILSNFVTGNFSGREVVRRLREVNGLAGSLVYSEIKKRGVDSTRDIIKMAFRRHRRKCLASVPQKREIPMADANSGDVQAVTLGQFIGSIK